MIRFLRLLAAPVLAGVLLAPQVPAPAQAASGACTSANGVTVVVSFGSLGGGTVVRCADTSGSGLDALHVAGFSPTGTQQDGDGFVCRIKGKPDTENCVNTPPTSSSWRYWYAANGGPWKFSQSGAGNRAVTQGCFEGWSFGGSSSPGYAPKRSGSSGSSGSTGSSDSSGSTDDSVLKNPSSTGDTSLPKPKPRAQKTAAGVPSDEAPPERDDGNSRPVAAEDSGNSAGPWVAGGILLALLIGVVATQARRARRRTG